MIWVGGGWSKERERERAGPELIGKPPGLGFRTGGLVALGIMFLVIIHPKSSDPRGCPQRNPGRPCAPNLTARWGYTDAKQLVARAAAARRRRGGWLSAL